MADKLDEALGLAVNKAMEGVEQLTVALQQLAAKHGEQAVDVMLTAARIDAINSVATNVIMVIFSLVCAYGVYRFIKTTIEKDWMEVTDGAIEIPIGLAGTSTLVIFFINMASVLNIWKWAGIFYPELWIIYKFILN